MVARGNFGAYICIQDDYSLKSLPMETSSRISDTVDSPTWLTLSLTPQYSPDLN